MEWRFTDDRPIWQQLTEQLTLRILKGEYPPGSRLPAVRELAAQAGGNPGVEVGKEVEEVGGLHPVGEVHAVGEIADDGLHQARRSRVYEGGIET